MNPDNPLIRNYDLPVIAGEALRVMQTKSVVEKLDGLFDADSLLATTGDSLKHLYQGLDQIVGSKLYMSKSAEMSEVYEEFDNDGVKLVSRIIRLKSEPGASFFDDSTTYLIALIGEDQSTVDAVNCPLGVVVAGEVGETVLFKIEKNEKLGELVVRNAVKDPESERVLVQEGHIDKRAIKVTRLSPEESYAAVMEFETAIAALGKE